IIGAVVSTTVIVAVQVLVLPCVSAAYNVTAVPPRPTIVAAVGLCETVTALQLSLAATSPVRFGIAARQLPLAKSVRLVAQVAMEGASLSTTYTFWVHVLLLP